MTHPLLPKDALYAVVVAGGSGSRMQSALAKQYLPLAGKPILMHTLAAFKAASTQIQLILVLPQQDAAYWQQLCRQYNCSIPHLLVQGGSSRFQSVKNGLEHVPADALVAIHDGVRPLVSQQVILTSFENAKAKGAAVAAVALKDSVRKLSGPESSHSLQRQDYRLVQTPQTFKAAAIQEAYQQPEQSYFTDCASVAEAAGLPVYLIEGSYSNIKITTPEDLLIAEALLKA